MLGVGWGWGGARAEIMSVNMDVVAIVHVSRYDETNDWDGNWNRSQVVQVHALLHHLHDALDA